jgi:uncharacterized peroxidase-related enzyme
VFLDEPPGSEATQLLYAGDTDGRGYVMNLTRLWAWRPDVFQGFTQLRNTLTGESSLTAREVALIVSTTASTVGDSYCSLVWGEALAKESDGRTAAGVLRGDEPDSLSEREAALVRWVRRVARDPNGTRPEDVERLRAAGMSEREIFEATAFAAFRLAFATVNDALGARPDRQAAAAARPKVRAAVTFGRAPDTGDSADEEQK